MKKRTLSAAEAAQIRDALQVAVLDALVASRRWEHGELLFQGGTALHLVHGSPRFSEDLDFLVSSSIDLSHVTDRIRERLTGAQWLPVHTSLTVTKAKDEHNPHAFNVTVGGPAIIGAVRVKVELWQSPESALQSLQMRVTQVRDRTGVQAFVPALTAGEIFADKVFALAARRYLKPRDVFDIDWLVERGDTSCSAEDLHARLAIYPTMSPATWIEAAERRRLELAEAVERVREDLARWLPPTMTISRTDAERMVRVAIESLDGALDVLDPPPRRRLTGPAP